MKVSGFHCNGVRLKYRNINDHLASIMNRRGDCWDNAGAESSVRTALSTVAWSLQTLLREFSWFFAIPIVFIMLHELLSAIIMRLFLTGLYTRQNMIEADKVSACIVEEDCL